MLQMITYFRIFLPCLFLGISFQATARMGETITFGRENAMEQAFILPKRGFCAHRGAMKTHPENTHSRF